MPIDHRHMLLFLIPHMLPCHKSIYWFFGEVHLFVKKSIGFSLCYWQKHRLTTISTKNIGRMSIDRWWETPIAYSTHVSMLQISLLYVGWISFLHEKSLVLAFNCPKRPFRTFLTKSTTVCPSIIYDNLLLLTPHMFISHKSISWFLVGTILSENSKVLAFGISQSSCSKQFSIENPECMATNLWREYHIPYCTRVFLP